MVSNNPLNQKYSNPYFLGPNGLPMTGVGQSYSSGVPMQALDGQAVQQAVDNSYYANRVKASSYEDEDPRKGLLAKAGLTVGSWYAICQLMDKFSEKCNGKYEDSILGKVGAFGDNLQNKFTGTWFGKKCQSGYRAVSNAWDKFAGKSKVLTAMRKTPTNGEWKFARGQGEGVRGFLGMDASGLFNDFMKPIKHAQQLEQFGYTQAQIDAFDQALKNIDIADRPIALLKEELKGLGYEQSKIDNLFNPPANRKYNFSKSELRASGVSKTDLDRLFPAGSGKNITGLSKAELQSLGLNTSKIDDIFNEKTINSANELTKRLKSKKLGFNSYKDFKICAENTYDHIDDIAKALDKADDKCCISIWRDGKYKAHFFGRKVGLSELRNKFNAMLGKGSKTKLGRGLTKSLGWVLEGTTNRFAGGKVAVLMQALITAGILYDTLKAPKGEKTKTFAERTVNDFSYFFAGPLAYIAMHKVGGMKYAGLDEAGVKAYRSALKEHNRKALAKEFASKADHKASLKALDDMLNAGVKNPLTKLCKKIGRLINVGNETRMAYLSKSTVNLNLLRRIPNFLKNCLGTPIRIAIPFFLIIPFVAKICTKGCHAIFGRPTKSVLDDEVDETQKTEQNAPQSFEALPNQQSNQQQNPYQGPIVHASPTNLLNMKQNGSTYTNTTNTYNNYNNSTEKSEDGKVYEPIRTYIPSPEGVKIVGEDMSAANMALQRAQAAEKQALDVLSMKW